MPKQSPQAAVQSTPKPKKKPNKMTEATATTDSKPDTADNEEDKEEDQSGNSESNVTKEPTSPRKDASTDPQTDMADMIKKDDLKDILECPVCLRVPRTTPIYQVKWYSASIKKLRSSFTCLCFSVPGVTSCVQSAALT